MILRSRVRALSASVALLGAMLVAHGLYIPAKAVVAQLLLERAWARAQQGAGDVRPWPWADTAPVGRVRVPRLDVDTIALAGASGRTLAFGPGHVPGSPRPGEGGNVVLAGHQDTHFAFLEHLLVGDEVHLEDVVGRTSRFVIEDAFVVNVSDTWVLAPTTDERLTLITCWPFGAITPGGPDRYVIIARRLADDDTASVREATGHGGEGQRHLTARPSS